MIEDISRLCSGMFSDELDSMGYRKQVVTGFIVNRSELKCFGPVRTLQLQTIQTPDENIRTGLGFLERLEPGQILCVAGSKEFAYFGELMSRLSIRRHLGGIIIDGLTRDNSFTQKLNELPVFGRGYSPKDIKGRGRVNSVDTPIRIGDIPIRPGDWIFGDSDGIVVIPAQVKSKLFHRIRQVVRNEKDIIRRVNQGESINEIIKHHKAF